MTQNEARARLVAEEMEKEARYGVFDLEKVKAIAGEGAAALKAARISGLILRMFTMPCRGLRIG